MHASTSSIIHPCYGVVTIHNDWITHAVHALCAGPIGFNISGQWFNQPCIPLQGRINICCNVLWSPQSRAIISYCPAFTTEHGDTLLLCSALHFLLLLMQHYRLQAHSQSADYITTTSCSFREAIDACIVTHCTTNQLNHATFGLHGIYWLLHLCAINSMPPSGHSLTNKNCKLRTSPALIFEAESTSVSVSNGTLCSRSSHRTIP